MSEPALVRQSGSRPARRRDLEARPQSGSPPQLVGLSHARRVRPTGPRDHPAIPIRTGRTHVLIGPKNGGRSVQFAFFTYLACGLYAKTIEALRAHGYHTKAFTSRNGIEHPGRPVPDQWLAVPPQESRLHRDEGDQQEEAEAWQGRPRGWVRARAGSLGANRRPRGLRRSTGAHGGEREIEDQSGEAVQTRLRSSSGLLVCGECGTTMEGRSGIGHLGVRYHYYACRNKDCKVRVAAPEIENVVLDRLGLLARSGDLLDKLVAATNARLNRDLPALQKRKRALTLTLRMLKDRRSGSSANWLASRTGAARSSRRGWPNSKNSRRGWSLPSGKSMRRYVTFKRRR